MANPEELDKGEVFAMYINGFYRNAALLCRRPARCGAISTFVQQKANVRGGTVALHCRVRTN